MAKRFQLAEFTKTLAWWNKTFISLAVTWDCFDQSNFYISRIDIEWNNIHLLHAGEGNMKIYSPKSIIFPEGNPRVSYSLRATPEGCSEIIIL
jgi:hypothetical protein